MLTLLNLAKLLSEDTEFRDKDDIEIEMGKKFMGLFPTEKIKKWWGLFKDEVFSTLTEEQIEVIIVRSGLLQKYADPKEAVKQVIKGNYRIQKNPTEYFKFQRLEDGNGNTIYQPVIAELVPPCGF